MSLDIESGHFFGSPCQFSHYGSQLQILRSLLLSSEPCSADGEIVGKGEPRQPRIQYSLPVVWIFIETFDSSDAFLPYLLGKKVQNTRIF